MRNIILSSLLIISFSLSATPTCDIPQNNLNKLYCLNKNYLDAENALNKHYNELYSKLNDKGQKSLKNSQLAWIDDRDHHCSKHEQNEFFVNLNCATATTIQRSAILQDRIRECTSSGCQNIQL